MIKNGHTNAQENKRDVFAIMASCFSVAADKCTSEEDSTAQEQAGEYLASLLLEACMRNATETALKLLQKDVCVVYEDAKQWSPLMWAACNGNTQLVRLLIKKGAASMYVPSSSTNPTHPITGASEPTVHVVSTLPATAVQQFADTISADAAPARTSLFLETKSGRSPSPKIASSSAPVVLQHRANVPFSAAGVISTSNEGPSKGEPDDVGICPVQKQKHSPLHWAAFKGHLPVMWLLLKEGLSPNARDVLGNSVLHQAAAGGSAEAVKCLLSEGVEVFQKNDRGHTALALATAAEVTELLEKAMNATACKATGVQFSYKVLRYMCTSSEEFFCREAIYRTYVFASADDDEMEKPVTWCVSVKQAIQEAERQLQNASSCNQLEAMNSALQAVEGVCVNVKLLEGCRRAKMKLESEIALNEAINLPAITIVDEFFEALDKIHTAIEDAQQKGADPALIQRAQYLYSRLDAELSLTRILDKPKNTNFRQTDTYIELLKKAIDISREKQVDELLLKRAERVAGTMDSQRELESQLKEIEVACTLPPLQDLEEQQNPEGLPDWHAISDFFGMFLVQFKESIALAEQFDVPEDLILLSKKQTKILEEQLIARRQLEEETRLKVSHAKPSHEVEQKKKKKRGKKKQ